MGNFEKNIPIHLKSLHVLLAADNDRLIDLQKTQHECDCEYCEINDEYGYIDEEEFEKQYAALEAEMAEARHLIRALEAHAKLHHMPVQTLKK